MAIKKSELYSSLWASCDELRGGMDASQYKDYILVLLFVKYVSDKYAGKKDALLDVPRGGSFADMVALQGEKDIGEKMNKIIEKLAKANGLQGVIDLADFNDPEKLGKPKEMVERLSSLVAIFNNPALDFRKNRAEGDDLLGDAYEYLMRHFATESGKSKGQFYTPAEVSRVMARVVGVGNATSNKQSIYDPTCGSGSLLLKAHDEVKETKGLDLAIYGQEKDHATSGLARMNMILHDCPTAEIWHDNVLSAPYFTDGNGKLKLFDFIVANPPFSDKNWTTGIVPDKDEFERFKLGVPPKKKGDMAYLLHILASLKSKGKAAVNLPHGVLFRGGTEADIRRELIRRGYIKAIIGLPANLFYGTNIAACIVVLDKDNAASRKGIFFIDASKGFMKDGNKNRLRSRDVHKIVDTFNEQVEIPKYSKMISLDEISDPKNDYNLNIPRYIDGSEDEDLQDIEGHLRGGIPNRDIDALEAYWKVCPSLREVLFEEERPGYGRLKLPISELREKILGHPEFAAFRKSVDALFEKWRKKHQKALESIQPGDKPRELIEAISEDLLDTFEKAPLLDPYGIYQHLMNYWAETLQDDVYLIALEGWEAAARPRLIVETKGQKSKEEPDFTVGKQKFKSDLLPSGLLVTRYFAAEQEAIEKLETEKAALEQELEELREEHGGEEGLLAEVIDDKGKIAKGTLTARVKEIGKDPDYVKERTVLQNYQKKLNTESAVKAKIKAGQQEREIKLAAKYAELDEETIQQLAVHDKWLAFLSGAVQREVDIVSQAMTGRVQELAERYAKPLAKLVDEVEGLSKKVDAHLKKMGAVWK